MEFHFAAETDPLVSKLDALAKRLEGLPQATSDELYNWEAEDLRRKSPWVRQLSRNRVFTAVRPHSAKTIRSRARRRRMRRELYSAFKVRLRRRPKPSSFRPMETGRPLLRPELLDRLQDRMIDLLRRTVRWG